MQPRSRQPISAPAADTAARPQAGRVDLIGAGPGDPELLTLRALRLLQQADVVVHDRLVSDAVMALIPKTTRRIFVGKEAGFHPVPQERINAILVDLARSGLAVARLKGGDPTIFGRGGEELLALQAAGIACGYVPGITAAQGAAASVGMPLTHRGLATGLRLVTGHRAQDVELDLDWASLADPATTLVVYMGAAQIAGIARRLIGQGMAGELPVLAVSKASTPDESRRRCDLAALATGAPAEGMPAPLLFIIGHVAALADDAVPSVPALPSGRGLELAAHD